MQSFVARCTKVPSDFDEQIEKRKHQMQANDFLFFSPLLHCTSDLTLFFSPNLFTAFRPSAEAVDERPI